jgi:hypothetical protein
MKTSFEIEKTKTGYGVALVTKRLNFLRAFFSGKLEMEIDKNLASTISKALYTPKKKSYPAKKSSPVTPPPPCE